MLSFLPRSTGIHGAFTGAILQRQYIQRSSAGNHHSFDQLRKTHGEVQCLRLLYSFLSLSPFSFHSYLFLNYTFRHTPTVTNVGANERIWGRSPLAARVHSWRMRVWSGRRRNLPAGVLEKEKGRQNVKLSLPVNFAFIREFFFPMYWSYPSIKCKKKYGGVP